MLFTRNTLLGFTLILMSFSTFSAEQVLRWGVNLEPLHYFIPAAKHFKRNVELRTNGRVKVELSFGEFKQDERDHLKDVETGYYHMGQETVFNLEKKAPELNLWNLPFLFQNNDQVFKYMESTLGKRTLNRLSQEKVVAINYTYSGGFVNIFGEKLDSFSDLKGKKLGLETSNYEYRKHLLDHYKIQAGEYGDNKLQNSEVISSTIDELTELPLKKRRYLNVTEHRVFARILFISKSFLNSLSKKDRAIVLEEANTSAIFEREMAVASTDILTSVLENLGTKINIWNQYQKAEAKGRFKGFYSKHREKFGGEHIDFIESLIINRKVSGVKK